MKKNLRFESLFAPTIESFGCELFGIESVVEGSRSVMRVYVEKEGGIGIDDLAKISRQLSRLIDVEMPDAPGFNLEVSSPGINRLLFTKEHYQKSIGKKVSVKLSLPLNGRRHFKGVLTKVTNESITLEPLSAEEEEVSVSFSDIEKARLIADI